VFFFVLFLTTSSFSEIPKTNLQRFQQGISEITNAVLREPYLQNRDTIIVYIDSSQYSWFIEQGITKALLEKGVYTKLSSINSISPSPLIEVHPSELTTQYSEPFRESIWGTRYITRKINISMFVTCSIPNSIQFNAEKKWSEIDTVQWDEVQTIESPLINFTVGTKTNSSWFDTYMEPFVVIGTTAVTIFLFFTVRS